MRESVQAVASPPVCHRRHEARYHGYPDDLEIQEIVSRNTLAKVQIGVWCRSGLLLTLLSNLNARPLRPKPKRRKKKRDLRLSRFDIRVVKFVHVMGFIWNLCLLPPALPKDVLDERTVFDGTSYRRVP